MTSKDLLRELRYVQNKHKDDKLQTFQTNISAMARDCMEVVEKQVDEITRLTAQLATVKKWEASKDAMIAKLANIAHADKRRADAAEEQLRTVNAMIGKVEKPSDTFSTTDGRGVQEGETE